MLLLEIRSQAETFSTGDRGNEYQNSLGMVFHPVHGAAVKFSIWETRVSDWKAYLAETHRNWAYWPTFQQTDEHPVVNVTLPEAQLFCEWLTNREHASGLLQKSSHYRLPTDLEWDEAVGVRKDSLHQQFPWGTEWPPPPDSGNYNTSHIKDAKDDGFPFTAPVGKFHPSADGLYDLGGNAWEWTISLSASSSKLQSSLRGASWMYWRKECLASSYVLPSAPDTRAPTIGFRCVLEDASDSMRQSQLNIAENNAQVHSLLDKPKISKEEIQKASADLLGGAAASHRSETHLAISEKIFINSEGIKMIPITHPEVLVAEHEVRVRDFRAFASSAGINRQADPTETDDEPVTRVTWMNATEFCLWLTHRERDLQFIPPSAHYRLIKLREWIAASGESAKNSPFPWGSVWPPPEGFANLSTNLKTRAKPTLKPVKSFPPNPLGFYDLTGNAAEWCVEVNPDAPTERTYCGGSWQSATPEDLRNHGLRKAAANTALQDVGFRLVLQFKSGEDSTPTDTP